MAEVFNNQDPGHLFMIGLPGTELDSSTLELIREAGIHNFILFRRNVASAGQIRRLCDDLVQACLENALPQPLISIDQEGGQVARLPLPFTQFPEPRQLAEDDNWQEGLIHFARNCARELLELGINMNLAPVLDICPTREGLFMERRCLGCEPHRVAALGGLVIREMQEAGLAACAKHFPGLGSAALDPHLELPVVGLSLEHFEQADLVPFQEARRLGVAAIMTSHALYSQLDSKVPGTLSRKVVHDLARKTCGYQGLIITDDLEMGAIENFMDFPQAALKAFQAGADLLLICHDHGKIKRALAAVKSARDEGLISGVQIAESLARQLEVLERFR